MNYYPLISIMPKAAGFDPDAQAFITAASITDPTQQSAINQLVLDLKGYSIWTKFKAIYPIVGGVASSHAVNLKTPGTYNLTYASGMTHSSTGMVANGSTGYANSNLNPSSALTLNSTHLSFYSRTSTITNAQREIAIYQSGDNPTMALGTNTGVEISDHYNFNNNRVSGSIASATGFYIGTRTTSTSHKLYKNNTTLGTNTTTNSNLLPNGNVFICGANSTNLGFSSSTKQCAFASIGDGLTDTEAANFYTAVQAYQTTLGRSIGTQTVSDPDAQAFITAANITDQVEANAVNNLVIGMKADGIWTKMKAIYPIVGGSASSHAVNLKTPGTFNLTFASGVTHSANGMVGNGSSGYADTNFTPSTNGMLLNSAHLSFYSRTDLNTYQVEMGNWDGTSSTLLLIRQAGNGSVRMNNGSGLVNFANTNAQGFYLSNRTASNVIKAFKNGTSQVTSTLASNSLPTNKIALLSFNNTGLIDYYSTKQCAFSSIGDGLTDTEAANFYTTVQAYQTALSRNV